MGLDDIGLIVGTVMTLLIFSNLLGDNILYRWALGLLVGSGAGYMLGIAIRYVLLQWLGNIIVGSGSVGLRVFYIIPLILGLLLLLKGFPKLAVVGNLSMGFLIGVGAAVALSGAILGTIIPQTYSSGAALNFNEGFAGFLQGLLTFIGTLAALLAFSPMPREKDGLPRPLLVWLQRLGRAFVVIALAVAFAGAVTSGLTLLVQRVWVILSTWVGS